jgi:hypothetical protein
LDDVLRYEGSKGLSRVARMKEVVEGDSEEVLTLRFSRRVRAAQEMLVFLVDGAAVRAPMIFELVVSMVVVAGWQPTVYTLHELFMLECRLLLEHLVEQFPGDEFAGWFGPVALVLQMDPVVFDGEHFRRVSKEELIS